MTSADGPGGRGSWRAPACPTCRKAIEPATPYVPFCSERCKMVDLGGWFLEKYRIPAVEDDDVVIPDALPDDLD